MICTANMKDSSLNSVYCGDCNWSIKNLWVCTSVTAKVLLLKRSHELMPPEMECAWPCLGSDICSEGDMLHLGNCRWSLCYDQKKAVYKGGHFSLRPDIFMCWFLNKVGSLLLFLFCGLADTSSEALRTLWVLAMIIFCVSHVRISKHFYQEHECPQWVKMKSRLVVNPREGILTGSHCSHSVLCSPVPDIWWLSGVKDSPFIVLPQDNVASIYSVYEVGRVSGGVGSLFNYRAWGLSFFPIVASRCFTERAEDLHDCEHFPSCTHMSPARAPWQVLDILGPASHLSTRNLLKMTWHQIFFLMLELWRLEVWNLASPKALVWVWVLVSQAIYEKGVWTDCTVAVSGFIVPKKLRVLLPPGFLF